MMIKRVLVDIGTNLDFDTPERNGVFNGGNRLPNPETETRFQDFRH